MRRVGKYELIELLGRGGCGEVWKARDTELGRVVALKLLQRTDAEDLARFKREAHVVAQLSHPNIAQLYEFSVDPPYLAMQYIEGGPISEAKEKIAALRDAARAVHFAHQRGILHRDLKPANIMVDSSGRASVLDFGLAREVKSDQTAMTVSGDILGTPSYMAPEQARGDVKNLDARTDVYGLGATLYFLLTGRPPHTGATAFDVISSVLNVDVSRPGGDRDLETICLKALGKEPGRRYASAEEFAEDLDRYLNREPIRARPASTFYRLKKRIQRQPVVWSLSSLLVVAIIGGSGFGVGMMYKRMKEKERAAADAARRLEAEGLLEAARRTLHRLEIMLREPEADPAEADVAKEALDWLTKVDRLYPDLAETHLERGRAYVLMYDDEHALAEFSKAIEKSPQLAGARLERAVILSGLYEDARHEWTGQARAETPGMADVRSRIVADVQAVETWSRDERDVEHAKGLLAFAQSDYAEATKHLRAYVSRNPTDPFAWAALGHALYHAAKFEESIDALTQAVRCRPRYVEAYGNRGIARKAKGDFEGAIADYNTVLALNPQDADAYLSRGLVHTAKGERLVPERRLQEAIVEFDGAIADFDGALRINPRFVRAFINRGNAKRMKGDLDGAFSDYDDAIRNDPACALAYFGRANARRARGDLIQSMADYDAAIRNDPKYAEAYANRGTLRRDQGDPAGAAADLREALRVALPNWPFRTKIEEALRRIEANPGPEY